MRESGADKTPVRSRLRYSGMIRTLAVIGLCVLVGAPLLPLQDSAAAVFALFGSTSIAYLAAASCLVATRRADGSARAGWAVPA